MLYVNIATKKLYSSYADYIFMFQVKKAEENFSNEDTSNFWGSYGLYVKLYIFGVYLLSMYDSWYGFSYFFSTGAVISIFIFLILTGITAPITLVVGVYLYAHYVLGYGIIMSLIFSVRPLNFIMVPILNIIELFKN